MCLRGGTYSLTSPLVFDPRDSAAEGQTVRYLNYAGEEPVVSGGRPIGGFKVTGDGLWEARIPDVAAELAKSSDGRLPLRHVLGRLGVFRCVPPAAADASLDRLPVTRPLSDQLRRGDM